MSQYVCDHRGVHEVRGSTLRNPDEALIVAWGGAPMSESGVRVTPQAMIGFAPILQGVTVLAGDVAMLPLMLKRKIGERTQEDTTHIAYRLAAEQPNSLMSSIEFWELMMVRAIIWGNGIAAIERDSASRPLGIQPLPPESTHPWMDDDGELWIKSVVIVAPGETETRYYDPKDTIHIRGLTSDGFWGYSLREVAQDTIGYGLSLRKHGNYTFRNRARPDFLLKHPGIMGPEGQENFRRSWYGEHGGVENVHRMAILEEGMEAQILGQTNEEAQMIDLVKVSVEDVSRIFNIPPHMLNLMDRSTFNNIEEQGRNYLNRTLGRWLRKVTQELRTKLLTITERTRYYFEHNRDELLKGTLKDRAEAYSKLIASTVLSPNEARGEEGWDPYEGGDKHENPNTKPTESTGQEPEPQEERRGTSQRNGHALTR